MKEIGGYFGLEQLVSSEYHNSLIQLNNARNCLKYLIKARNIKKVYIPYFLCGCISEMCRRNGYEYEFYNINAEFMPVFEKELSSNEYLLIVNYYGQVTEEKIHALKEKYGRIIMDNTQAFFQRPVAGIDTLYSCRKFFGVPDGGYLYTEALLKEELELDISGGRMKHILGRLEGKASDYHADAQENDEKAEKEPLKYMSKLTHNILGAIDYERARSTRNMNYRYLAERLDSENSLTLVYPRGAFAYPFYMKNSAEIRRKLVQKKIYIPTLWPNVLTETPQDSLEYDYASNIMPLPCDQRYITNDMQYLIDEMRRI